jgi:hypothetical protein
LKTFSFQHDYAKIQKNAVPRDDFEGCEHVGHVYMMTSDKKRVTLDTPMLVGSAILARSKVHMQRCFYDLCACYPPGAVRLIMSDTDSFVLEIATEDYYRDLADPKFYGWRRHLDLSSYTKFGDWRSELAVHPDMAKFEETPADAREELVAELGTTASVPSFLKDELMSKLISYMTEIVALRSKMYCFDEEVDGVVSLGGARAKGVPLSKYMVRRPLTEVFREVLQSQRDAPPYAGTAIRCKDFQLHTVDVAKKSISAHDDKFYVSDTGEKYPYGYCVQSK